VSNTRSPSCAELRLTGSSPGSDCRRAAVMLTLIQTIAAQQWLKLDLRPSGVGPRPETGPPGIALLDLFEVVGKKLL